MWCPTCLMAVEQPEDCPGGTPSCAFRITEAERERIIKLHRKRAVRYAKKRRKGMTEKNKVKPRKGGKRLKVGEIVADTHTDPKRLTKEVLDG